MPSKTPSTKSVLSQTEPSATGTISPVVWTPPPTPTSRVNVPLQSGQSIVVTSIQMIDSQNGWGFDSDFHILRTPNGGKTWQDVSPPTGYFERRGFFALDADTAWATFTYGLYAMPTSAYVWRTIDGGETWTPSDSFPINLNSSGANTPSDFYIPLMMQFIDEQTGWLLVYVYAGMNSTRPLLLHTTNSGATWTTINDREHGLLGSWGCLNVGFAFVDAQTGWVGSNCIAQGVIINPLQTFFPLGGWAVSKTTDAGYTFDSKTVLPLSPELQEIKLSNDETVCGETRVISFAVNVVGIEWECRNFTRKMTYRYFVLTTDGGQTWNSWASAGNEFFLDEKHGWRLFPSGALQHTSDKGLTWTTIKSVSWDNAQFDFVSDQIGWAIVTRSNVTALVHTTDGGKTWTEIRSVIAP